MTIETKTPQWWDRAVGAQVMRAGRGKDTTSRRAKNDDSVRRSRMGQPSCGRAPPGRGKARRAIRVGIRAEAVGRAGQVHRSGGILPAQALEVAAAAVAAAAAAAAVVRCHPRRVHRHLRRHYSLPRCAPRQSDTDLTVDGTRSGWSTVTRRRQTTSMPPTRTAVSSSRGRRCLSCGRR